VRRLAAEGAPIRGIAAEVFGDERFRGRVERILRAPEQPEADVRVLDAQVVTNAVPVVRQAFGRYLARVAAGIERPSLNDLLKALELERRLQAAEMVEQMNALTREVAESVEAA
jgi:hypothetical protein